MSVQSYANEQYLGDGVYIMEDHARNLLITANGTPGYGATDVIYLADQVVTNLLKYLKAREHEHT